MNNAIQSGMSAMASLNPSAVEPVGGQAVHISSTEAALVGLAKGVPRWRPTANQMR